MHHGEDAVVELLLAQRLVVERHEVLDVTTQLIDSMLPPRKLLRVWVGQVRSSCDAFSQGVTDGAAVFRVRYTYVLAARETAHCPRRDVRPGRDGREHD